MTFACIDDHFDEHPKFADLELEHFGLMICAIVHCNRLLTDGRVADRAVRGFGVRGDGLQVAARLVEKGIWRRVEGGFEIVGYLDHNRSRVDVEALREQKKASGRRGGQRSAEVRATKYQPQQPLEPDSPTSLNPIQSSPTQPSPTRSSPTQSKSKEEGDTRLSETPRSIDDAKIYEDEASKLMPTGVWCFSHGGEPSAIAKAIALYRPIECEDDERWLRAALQQWDRSDHAAVANGFKPYAFIDWLRAGRPDKNAGERAARADEGVAQRARVANKRMTRDPDAVPPPANLADVLEKIVLPEKQTGNR